MLKSSTLNLELVSIPWKKQTRIALYSWEKLESPSIPGKSSNNNNNNNINNSNNSNNDNT